MNSGQANQKSSQKSGQKSGQDSGRERQKRWRERRKSEGKKVLTVTLSEDAKMILEKVPC